MPRNALGRGLGALIREPEPQVPAPPTQGQPHATSTSAAAAATAREAAHADSIFRRARGGNRAMSTP